MIYNIHILAGLVASIATYIFTQDEPLTPEDDVDRRKQQVQEDDSSEFDSTSFKKFPVEVNSLTRVRVLPLNVKFSE